ncbi:thioredoxin reductase [Corynascus novoguineensis]|uniref:Thioredoxin reductase n=1 Tax=Corynascus novoguineensis TaxID=1126955 RepID=A0AAN7HP00_9PEZI|nr:thioredoxin reductase [Corynascus novoguineensis]
MGPFFTLALTALAAVTNAAAIRQAPIEYDAIIVGGGPAGLSAASGLARVRRNILLIDSGEYRNAPTRHMHDVLGFDGVTPAYFRWAARQQINHYGTVTMTNGTVVRIDRGDDKKTRFVVSARNNNDNDSEDISYYVARKIVLATGLRDVLPETPGLRENWGNGIFWCPWCDGHEHADQRLGLLGSLDHVPSSVREVVTLNKDIIAFVNGTDTPEYRAITTESFKDWERYLQIHDVPVDNRTIAAIERLRNGTTGDEDPSLPTVPEHDLFRVNFTNGEFVERDAFLASFPSEQTSNVGEQLGVRLVDGRLFANQSAGLITNIPGVYAVGDANSDGTTNVPHALFTGKRVAVYLHVAIAREDGEAELSSADVSKRDLEPEARSLWDTVNGAPGDILYAGEFDQ